MANKPQTRSTSDSNEMGINDLANMIKSLHAELFGEVTTLRADVASVESTLSAVQASLKSVDDRVEGSRLKIESLTVRQKELADSVDFAHTKLEDTEKAM